MFAETTHKLKIKINFIYFVIHSIEEILPKSRIKYIYILNIKCVFFSAFFQSLCMLNLKNTSKKINYTN